MWQTADYTRLVVVIFSPGHFSALSRLVTPKVGDAASLYADVCTGKPTLRGPSGKADVDANFTFKRLVGVKAHLYRYYGLGAWSIFGTW